MLFSVFTLDNPDALDKRKAVHGAHVAHLKRAKDYGVTITVGGPLVSDDGATSIGSLMVLEAPDRAAAGPPGRVATTDSNALARPKSSTLTRPSGVTLMFAGFRSRWMTPCPCAASSAPAI